MQMEIGLSWYTDAYKCLFYDGRLETRVLEGIALQLLGRGEDSLSPRQREVIESVVDRFCAEAICRRHGASIEVDEVDCWLSSGMCSFCDDQAHED
jgi:hypothetical protein